MSVNLDNKLVVAISSRALFNLEEENRVYESGNPQAYMTLQFERLDLPAGPGIAFSLIKKLLASGADPNAFVDNIPTSRRSALNLTPRTTFATALAHRGAESSCRSHRRRGDLLPCLGSRCGRGPGGDAGGRQTHSGAVEAKAGRDEGIDYRVGGQRQSPKGAA